MCRFVRATAGPATIKNRIRINITQYLLASFKLPALPPRGLLPSSRLATAAISRCHLASGGRGRSRWGVAGVMLNCQHPLSPVRCSLSTVRCPLSVYVSATCRGKCIIWFGYCPHWLPHTDRKQIDILVNVSVSKTQFKFKDFKV